MANGNARIKQKPIKATKEQLTDDFLQEIMKVNGKVYLGFFTNLIVANKIGFDISKPIKISLQGDKIEHTINKHGENSNLVLINKKEPTNFDDIRNHTDIVNNAELYSIKQVRDTTILLCGIQVNGYYIVVESIKKSQNELKFKGFYKEKGNLAENKDFIPSEEVRALMSDGHSYAPKINLSVGLDNSSRTIGNNYTTNLSQSQELDREIFKELDAYNKASEKQNDDLNKENLGGNKIKKPPKL